MELGESDVHKNRGQSSHYNFHTFNEILQKKSDKCWEEAAVVIGGSGGAAESIRGPGAGGGGLRLSYDGHWFCVGSSYCPWLWNPPPPHHYPS